ncbi:hypothetical protein [Pseudomonas rhizoryzae]|uniref:hypothetical protein n=1 Tax=Pseudomonas rhizoryzae TaxID=2571129 RepID=UPI0013050D18|nr:hypothetical protein [Pseudomonas rhizoryzae]
MNVLDESMGIGPTRVNGGHALKHAIERLFQRTALSLLSGSNMLSRWLNTPQKSIQAANEAGDHLSRFLGQHD